jgi:hypothetical protein
MNLSRLAVALLICLAALRLHAAEPYSIKVVDDTAPPAEAAEPIRKLLEERCIQLLGGDEVLMELWFRKEVPVKATAAQIDNGLTYREVPETTLVGVLRLAKEGTDYRKQQLEAGVYTLRLAVQPVSDDHLCTAPYRDFLLASPAAEDRTPALMSARSLREMSAKAGDNHPSPFLLFPGKGAAAAPKLVDKGKGHWVLLFQLGVKADKKKAILPIGLTLMGTSAAR